MRLVHCMCIALALNPLWALQSYDESLAEDALLYSYAAYCDESSLNQWSCKYCKFTKDFEIKHVISGNSLQAFIGYDPVYSQIVLSFRGTTNNANRWADVAEGFLPYDNPPDSEPYNVHYGIYSSYKALESLNLSQKMSAVIKAYPNANILVTGHSLGGALAAIAALDLKVSPIYDSSKHLMGDVNVITFGSPKWCNKNLAKYFDSVIDASFRVVNKNDVIPSNPPGWLGYDHVAIEIRYTNNDPLTYKVCEEPYGNSNGCRYGISVPDHLNYFGKKLDCGSTDDVKMGMFGYNMSETTAVRLKNAESDNINDDDPWMPLDIAIVLAVVCLIIFVIGFCAYMYRKKQRNMKHNYRELNETEMSSCSVHE